MSAKHTLLALLGLVCLALPVDQAHAFCGFYIAKADTELFNEASKVVIVRHDRKTVITMVNDYKGDPKEFAIVVPVPTVLQREQIHITEGAIVEHLDAYTAPRLVEYFDDDPCRPKVSVVATAPLQSAGGLASRDQEAALGVKIEARYTVGEYDILILSAAQSDGLRTWLVRNGYRLPQGVVPVLDGYIAKGMKFFVAKVNLTQRAELGFTYLRPLQLAFESPDFMLPIRLGMVNANGPQELFIFILTRRGRVEAMNYRTVRIPSNVEVPIFVKDEFGSFYSAMFDRQVENEDRRAVFLEYAWNMAWCDPCAADPLSVGELRELGVFWLRDTGGTTAPKAKARDAFVTRLHVRYDADHFPEDLRFRETTDRSNFQGRYVLRHPWSGPARCEAAKNYFEGLPKRFEREARNLASFTDWPVEEIRSKMEGGGQSFRTQGDDPSGGKP